MKLLIITQKIDKNDTVLGFFHRWVEELSKHFEHIMVICLEEGEYNLPENTTVLSLGKEDDVSRVTYLTRFYTYIWKERKNYDAVFVHMNQEYILLGWKLWKLLGKRIVFWRNHSQGNFLTNIAVWISDTVYCTSTSSYTARFKKTKLMPVGIDEKMFKRDFSIQRNNDTILSLGRISPIKKIDVLIDALILLDEKGIDFNASIYGDVPSRDVSYLEKLKQQGIDLLKKDKLVFHKGIPHRQIPKILNTHQIFVNMTPSGSFDKTILEAMACESIVIFSNDSLDNGIFQNVLVKQNDATSLAQKLEAVLRTQNNFEKITKEGREYVIKNHSLSLLVSKLVQDFAI